MSAPVIVLMFVLGLALTIKGGDLFVDAATWIAEVSGIPKFLIGATIVSLCTTLPELLVSLMASAEGRIGIAVGNAVGSVTANTGLIMGISVVWLASPIDRKQQAFKYLMMAGAIALLLGFCASGSLGIAASVVMLALFAANMGESVAIARGAMRGGREDEDEKPEKDRRTVLINAAKFVLGVAGIVVGADLLVNYGTALARLLGVSEAIIGATLVAVGTSLPELVTTVTALVKRQAGLSIGNVVGANIIDLTLILPLCSLVSGKPLPILPQNIRVDMPVCLGLSLLAVVPPLIEGRFRRWQGVTLLILYAAYVVTLCTGVFG